MELVAQSVSAFFFYNQTILKLFKFYNALSGVVFARHVFQWTEDVMILTIENELNIYFSNTRHLLTEHLSVNFYKLQWYLEQVYDWLVFLSIWSFITFFPLFDLGISSLPFPSGPSVWLVSISRDLIYFCSYFFSIYLR